jgi:hypothetical protein
MEFDSQKNKAGRLLTVICPFLFGVKKLHHKNKNKKE